MKIDLKYKVIKFHEVPEQQKYREDPLKLVVYKDTKMRKASDFSTLNVKRQYRDFLFPSEIEYIYR